MCWIAYRKVFSKLLLKAGGLVFGGKQSGNQNGMNSQPEASLADLLKRKMPYEPAIAMGTLMSFFAR